jgi:release factor glutamine methyltransferase
MSTQTLSIGQLLQTTIQRLNAVTDTPLMDAQVLLAEYLNKPRTWIVSHPEAAIPELYQDLLEAATARLEQGESLPYVLGHWEFFGQDFDITPDVLIPRPETELLVERSLDWLLADSERRTVADVGTGSGCIAVSLALQIPDLKLLATDLSMPALEVARCNAIKHGVAKRISFVQCDLLPPHYDPLPTDSHFDLVVANLPYIPTKTLKKLDVYDQEPTLALDGGPDGLVHIRRLLDLAPDWLAPGGMIMLEIEATQGMAALSLAYDSFNKAEIRLHKDLAGRDRLIEIQL